MAAVIVCLYLWQPSRQVRVHTEALFSAVEGKKWEKMTQLLVEDYSDRWGHDRAEVVDRARQVFSQFIVLQIEAKDLDVQEAEGQGQATGRLTLAGNGGPLAELVMQRAATLQEPFVFEWRQRSWKPWDWGLVRVDQPEIEMVEY